MIEKQGGFITDLMLKTEASEIYNSLKENSTVTDGEDFKASNGWLYRFKKRHNISLKQCSGDSFIINNTNYDDFLMLLNGKMEQYDERDIFNCDETVLFYKLAPSKSLFCRARNGIKRYKNRIKIMMACNMLGNEKNKLFVI
ncbi:CENP-B like protein 2 [Dictyocoela muelleri]|nr:CENP-B like protein 2 [Dictyocoela muelleri]